LTRPRASVGRAPPCGPGAPAQEQNCWKTGTDFFFIPDPGSVSKKAETWFLSSLTVTNIPDLLL
jgi:hypothetical protein